VSEVQQPLGFKDENAINECRPSSSESGHYSLIALSRCFGQSLGRRAIQSPSALRGSSRTATRASSWSGGGSVRPCQSGSARTNAAGCACSPDRAGATCPAAAAECNWHPRKVSPLQGHRPLEEILRPARAHAISGRSTPPGLPCQGNTYAIHRFLLIDQAPGWGKNGPVPRFSLRLTSSFRTRACSSGRTSPAFPPPCTRTSRMR
jgi:hypothetical protein